MGLIQKLRSTMQWFLGTGGSGAVPLFFPKEGGSSAALFSNPEIAMNFSAVFQALRVVSEPLATVPLVHYRRMDRGKLNLGRNRMYKLLNVRPNKYMTSSAMRGMIISSALGWGNGYAEIIRDDDEIVGFMPLHPSLVSLEVVGGDIRYRVLRPDGSHEFIYSKNMIHLCGPSPDGILGWSVLRLARESIYAGLASEQHTSSFLMNGGRTSGAFITPHALPMEKREQLLTQLQQKYGGSSSSGKFMLLWGGLSFTPMSMNHDDAQFLQLRGYTVQEIARWFNVTPHRLMDLGRATWGNIDHEETSFVVNTLRPWAVRLEQELNFKLAKDEEDETFFEHNMDAMLRGDPLVRANSLQILRRNGVLSANEWRDLYNMNPIEGGDTYIVESNMRDTDEESSSQTQAPPPIEDEDDDGESQAERGDDLQRWMGVLSDAYRRCLRRQLNETKKAVQKWQKTGDVSWLNEWANSFYSSQAAYCDESLRSILCALFGSQRAAKWNPSSAVLGSESEFVDAVVAGRGNGILEFIESQLRSNSLCSDLTRDI